MEQTAEVQRVLENVRGALAARYRGRGWVLEGQDLMAAIEAAVEKATPTKTA